MKYVIGLTGGTGAGKSRISAYLKEKGAFVIDADELSREITKKDGIALPEIDEHFKGVIKDGVLDRKALGEIVFVDHKKLKKLNEITHKHILKLTLSMMEGKDGIIVLDSPLLYEAGEDKFCDAVIFVDANEDVRIKRIKERDSLTDSEAKKRIDARDLSKIIKKADFIISNNGDLESAKKQIDDILKTL